MGCLHNILDLQSFHLCVTTKEVQKEIHFPEISGPKCRDLL